MMQTDTQQLDEATFEVTRTPLKRGFDLFFSTFVLTMGLPLYIAIALTIRLTSSGKIIYSQERIGRGGKPFRCYKFRTMYEDADVRLKEILEANPHLKVEWEKNRKLKEDPRITSVGIFLRSTSLDEFPQFWNVLRGDLSVVGPRPVVHEEMVKHFGPKAKKVFSIRPGLTGLWQISGRSNTSYEQRIILDEKYVDQHSFWMDLKLIALTIPTMIFRKGAY